MLIPDIGEIHAERYALWKAGLSYADWRLLTRWQRLDLGVRHQHELKARAELIKKEGLGGLIQALASKLLGF